MGVGGSEAPTEVATVMEVMEVAAATAMAEAAKAAEAMAAAAMAAGSKAVWKAAAGLVAEKPARMSRHQWWRGCRSWRRQEACSRRLHKYSSLRYDLLF